MSKSPFRESRFDEGYLVGEDWFCRCDERALWRTAHKEAYKDMKFLRCPRIETGQCSFIIWEEDEPAARQQKLSTLPPLPQTPAKQKINPGSLPTPTSNASGDRTSRSTFLQSLNMSPTSRRLKDIEINSSEDKDLSAAILELLHLDNVQLRTSTEVKLRHKIEIAVSVYEARLRRSDETISELHKKLDELEGAGAAS